MPRFSCSSDTQAHARQKTIDEETLPGYNARDYFPANPGDVLDGRYSLISKFGWGSTSIVWLAQVIDA
jgi:hypothetical protein